jgi:hypothetical protein
MMRYYWATERRTNVPTVLCRVDGIFNVPYWLKFGRGDKYTTNDIEMLYHIGEEILADTTRW